jgi:hypothetical protein
VLSKVFIAVASHFIQGCLLTVVAHARHISDTMESMDLKNIKSFLDDQDPEYQASQANIKSLEECHNTMKALFDKSKLFQAFKSGVGCSGPVKDKLAQLDSKVSQCKESSCYVSIQFVCLFVFFPRVSLSSAFALEN